MLFNKINQELKKYVDSNQSLKEKIEIKMLFF